MSGIAYEIFISSAMDALESEREIAKDVVEELNMQPGMFELLPAMSKSLDDAYLDKVESCDLFILILDQEIRPAVREEYKTARRMGKPIIIANKRPRQPRKGQEGRSISELLEDLYEAPFPPGAEMPYSRPFDSIKGFKEDLKQAILNELSLQATQVPRTARTKKDLYRLATAIIESAKQRVFVFQRTPTLLLGPRPYMGEMKIFYEKEFLDVLEKWIAECLKDSSKEFMYLFSHEATQREIANEPELQERVTKNLRKYKEIEKQSGYRMRFSCPRTDFSGPIAIGDDRFSLWIAGDDDAVFLSFQNKRLTDEIVQVFEEFGSCLLSEREIIARLDF